MLILSSEMKSLNSYIETSSIQNMLSHLHSKFSESILPNHVTIYPNVGNEFQSL
jgi:hypothetical protein